MLHRAKLEKLAEQYIFVACVGENKKGAVVIPVEIACSISMTHQSTAKKTHKPDGINVCKARIVGTDGNERLMFDPGTDFLFSVQVTTLRQYCCEAIVEQVY